MPSLLCFKRGMILVLVSCLHNPKTIFAKWTRGLESSKFPTVEMNKGDSSRATENARTNASGTTQVFFSSKQKAKSV